MSRRPPQIRLRTQDTARPPPPERLTAAAVGKALAVALIAGGAAVAAVHYRPWTWFFADAEPLPPPAAVTAPPPPRDPVVDEALMKSHNLHLPACYRGVPGEMFAYAGPAHADVVVTRITDVPEAKRAAARCIEP